jgi:nucleotide-binding universal stress UspA family protein
MEQPIRNVVVGFDFSPQASWAVQVALDLAARSHAKVHVTTSIHGHVDPNVMRAAIASAQPHSEQLFPAEALLEKVTEKMQAVVNPLNTHGIKVNCEATAERPLEAILHQADLQQADMIVVGNTGLDAMERLLIGSTSQKLVHTSRFPVLIARHYQPWPPRNILCPVDFSEASRRALGWAAELSQMTGGALHLLHVHERPPTYVQDVYGLTMTAFDEQLQQVNAELMKRIQDFCDTPDLKGVNWTAHLEHGRVDERIAAVIEKTEADLLCIGSAGRKGVANFLIGNTAERLLRNLKCSLLVIKPDTYALEG